MSVRLQLNNNIPSSSQQFVSIISVYAPTHKAAAEKFYDDLQAVICLVLSLWLRSYNHCDRQKYLTQRRLVACKVWECKNRWYQEKARSIQAALSQNRPSVVWQDIHAICKSRVGLQPVKPRAVKKQDGSFCSRSVETLGQ